LSTPPERLHNLPAPEAPVADEIDVYRLIPVGQCDVVDGRWEFQSSAFDNSTPFQAGERDDEMSVVLQDTLEALDRVPERLPLETPCSGDPDLWGVARLNVGFLRNDEAQEVLRSPNSEELAHGDVRGTKNSSRRRRLKKHAEWIIRPGKDPG
jgi:hypothetical protein